MTTTTRTIAAAGLGHPLFAFVIAAAPLLAACERIDGSGLPAVEHRALAPFDRVEVSAGLEVDLSLGEPDLTVSGDDNLLPAIRTAVEARTLFVDPIVSFEPRVPLRIEVRTQALRGARLRAGGRLTARDVRAAELLLQVDSGGELVASGAVDRLEATLQAGGLLDARSLPASFVEVHGAAGGEIRVTASEAIAGAVEGGALLRVYGAPARRSVTATSGGTIQFE